MTSMKSRCIFGSFMILFSFSYGLPAQDLSLSDLARVRSGRSAAVTSSEPDFRSNLDRVTYIKPGETLVMADISGPAVIQHIWLTFNEARPVLELEFEIDKEEYRGLVLRFTKADDYGIYRILLDGKNVADIEIKDWLRSVDFYSERLTANDLYVGSLRLAKGKHVLRLEGVGRNPLSKGGLLGLDSVRLRERWNKRRTLLRK